MHEIEFHFKGRANARTFGIHTNKGQGESRGMQLSPSVCLSVTSSWMLSRDKGMSYGIDFVITTRFIAPGDFSLLAATARPRPLH